MKNIFILFFLLLFVLFIIYLFRKEKFSDPKLGKGFEPNFDKKSFEPGKEYVRTLGDWGKPEPQFCFQNKPEKDALDLENKNKVCNACRLMCSSKKAWNRCQTCLKLL